MKQSILLLATLATVISCGDKHTFDTPNSVDNYTYNNQSESNGLKKITLIVPHKNPADYYNDEIHERYLSKFSKSDAIETKDLQDLKIKLNKVLKYDHTRVTGKRDSFKRCPRNAPETNECYSHDIEIYNDYQTARKYLFGKIHLDTNSSGEYILDTIYCQETFESNDLGNPQYGIGIMQIPDHNTVNTEHIWPRSKFDEKKDTLYYNVKLSDLHNLYPSSSRANSDRSNYPFGTSTDDDRILSDVSEYCTSSNAKVFERKGVKYFEAPDEAKGDIARAMFYVATRYYNSNKPTAMNIDEAQENILREWHKLDPVSEAERERNNKVFSIQHNRNPFVDYPELVELINDF